MAEKSNTVLLNFSSGEISQYMAARTDIDSYNKSLSWCQNFIILPQGGLRYRPGSLLCGLTKTNLTGALIPFQFSASDAMMIVATNNVFRFYRNDATVLNTAVNITGASKAGDCNITAPGHNFNNGDEVYIQGVAGMTQLNNRFFQVTNSASNTFSILDQYGNNVNSTQYGAYVSGGTAASIYELTVPYLQPDLLYIRVAQVGDVMYVVCANPTTGAVYPPYKLTRSNFTSWTIQTYSRTNDPFDPATQSPTQAYSASAITNANPAVVSATTTGMKTGDVVLVSGVVGMTELNGNFYQVTVIDSGSFSLQDLNGNNIDSSAYNIYGSAGTFTDTNIIGPASVFFTGDGRLGMVNTKQNPSGFWASELPSGTTSNFDNYTTGSTDSDAMIYALSPVNGIIDNIQDACQFSGNIAFLNASTIELMFGANPGTPPTPTAIGTQPTYQGAFYARSIVVNWDLIFIDVNQLKLRGMQYNLAFSDYQAIDYTLAAQHLGEESKFIKVVWVKGIPEIIWVLRADGNLLSFTFNNIEKVQAWSRVYPGGNGQVIDIAAIRNANGNDELWMLVQRMINGNTTISVEVLSQWPVFPAPRQFYTAPQNKLTDLASWQNAAWEAGKTGNFLDMATTYNGRSRGSAASATITPSAISGNITITASAPVFQASDVGQQIWKDYSATGVGGGQAIITGYTSTTQITAEVIGNFDTIAAIAAGAWGFAVNQINNLQIFNGQVVNVQADGAAHPAQTVVNGAISLQWFAEIVQVGFGYIGLAATNNLAPPSKAGVTASKPRNLKRIRARVCETIGGYVGASEYALQQLVMRQSNQITNRCPPPFSGLIDLAVLSTTTNDTVQVVIVQSDPTPCTITALDVEIITSDPP